MVAVVTARDTRTVIITAARVAILMVVTITEVIAAVMPRAAILMVIIIMDSITGRVTRIMARDMDATLIVTMVQAGAAQEIYAVTSGVQIRFANVWEEICAVAFKNKGNCMGWHAYGTCSNTYCVKWCY